MRQVQDYLPRLDLLWRKQENFSLTPHLAALFRVGSHSHGTYIPPVDPTGIDDVDFMAIVIPPRERILGLRQFDHGTMKVEEIDCVVYSWNKYIRLLMKSNPNVIGTLYLRPEDMYLSDAEPMRSLIAQRDVFISKQVYHSFMGYAKGQLYKMTHNAHQGYMGAKRKALVEQFGYDTKNAAHLIRLMRMAIEFLNTNVCIVYRYDAERLKAIKRGEWTLEQVHQEANQLIKAAEDSFKHSTLQERPPEHLVEQILLYGYKCRGL